MQRRPEFSFPGSSPARPPVNRVPPRPAEKEEIRWLQASRQASPDYYHHSSSGTPSPQMWAHHEHQFRPYPASAGSSPSSSRAQAIAGYRREMLHLVRGLPETAYELSLRDIVEHHHHHPSSSSPPAASTRLPTPRPPPAPLPQTSNADVAREHEPMKTAADVEEQGAKQSKAKQRAAVRRQRSRSMERSVSLDTGLLIKFFLPLSIGRKGGGGKKKVSPKPDAKAAKRKKKKQGTKEEPEARQRQDEEWWTKGEFSEASSETSTRTSSTGSSNSNRSAGSVANGQGNGGGGDQRRAPPLRSRSRKRNGCYAFFRAHKSKKGVSQD